MEERDRGLRLRPGWRVEDWYEVGTGKLPVESRISIWGWDSSDNFTSLKGSSWARWLAVNAGVNAGVKWEEGSLLWWFGEELRDLEALTSAIRSKRWTSDSTKLSCLPFESYLERGMSVVKGVAKYEGKINVLDIMMTLDLGWGYEGDSVKW